MTKKKLRWKKIDKSALTSSRLNMIALFDPSPDPFIVVQCTLPAEAILELVASEKQRTGKPNTITFTVMKMLAIAVAKHQEFNSLVLGGNIYELEDVSMTVPFLIPGTDKELTSLVFDNPQQMTLEEIQDASDAMMKVQQTAEATQARLKGSLLPVLLIKTGLYRLIGEKFLFRLMHERGLGSNIVLTNASHRGKSRFLLTKSAIQILRIFTRFYLHGIEEKPVVEDGKIVPRKQMTLSIAFDHRLIDGIHLNEFLETLEELANNPGAIAGTKT
jgi:chloramphenicol O-acetyltransferase